MARRNKEQIYNDLVSGKTNLTNCKQYLYLNRKKKDFDAVMDYLWAMEKYKMFG